MFFGDKYQRAELVCEIHRKHSHQMHLLYELQISRNSWLKSMLLYYSRSGAANSVTNDQIVISWEVSCPLLSGLDAVLLHRHAAGGTCSAAPAPAHQTRTGTVTGATTVPPASAPTAFPRTPSLLRTRDHHSCSRRQEKHRGCYCGYTLSESVAQRRPRICEATSG